MKLVEFLLARIAEDEAAAREASRLGGDEPDTSIWFAAEVPGPTMRKTFDQPTETIIDSPGSLVTYGVAHREFAEHIARHDPARVLAECEAKRRIVAGHVQAVRPVEVVGTLQGGDPFVDAYKVVMCSTCGNVPRGEPACPTLRDLALPYADHPDYDEEWKP